MLQKNKTTINYLAFEFIQDCNLSCQYCYNIWKSPNAEYPNLKTNYKAAIKTLKQIYRQANVNHLTFTGGEPMLFQRLEELILYVRKKGTQVNLITNGTFPDPIRFKNISELGVQAVEFTLNHFRPEIHEQLNGHKGSYFLTLTSIDIFKKLKSNVVISVILNKQNIDDIEETIRFIHNLGIKRIMLNRFNIGGAGIESRNNLEISKEQLNKAFSKVNQIAAELNLQVYSAITTPLCVLDPIHYTNIKFSKCSDKIENKILTMDISGNIRICNHSPSVLGNIYDENIKDILNKENAGCWNHAVPAFCSKCKLFNECHGGCRAAAEQVYQSVNQPDPVVFQ